MSTQLDVAPLKVYSSNRESKERRYSDISDVLLLDRLRTKMKKLKIFWENQSKISPHIFKFLKVDPKTRNFFYQISDLGNKCTNQKGLEERKEKKEVFKDFSIYSQDERISNPLSLENLRCEQEMFFD